jgi:acetyl esterase/lipase
MRAPNPVWRLLAAPLLLILLLAAASGAGAEERKVKVGGQQVRLIANLPYGPAKLQRFDVYLPDIQYFAPQHAPIILMVHGGGWENGDKAMSRVTDNKVARWVPKGIIFVSTNYPMIPESDPVAQADDIARALAEVQKQAAGWGGDPAKVILMGHSAGAHLVSLLNADPLRAAKLGAKPWIGVVSLDSGALDVPAIMNRRHNKLYDDAFGADPEFWKASSPMHQLKAGGAPWLGVCSDMIRNSCPENRDFATAAKKLSVRVEVLPQKLRHGPINADLGAPGAYTDAVEKFLASLDPKLAAMLGK